MIFLNLLFFDNYYSRAVSNQSLCHTNDDHKSGKIDTKLFLQEIIVTECVTKRQRRNKCSVAVDREKLRF